MIPHRLLHREASNTELRDRVTACRKRLRETRVMTRVNANTDVEPLFPEATLTGLRSGSRGNNTPDDFTLLAMEDEVGIT